MQSVESRLDEDGGGVDFASKGLLKGDGIGGRGCGVCVALILMAFQSTAEVVARVVAGAIGGKSEVN